ncbi:tyrosine-protein phosphatase non-receptor type 4-like isoform X2 [Pomacea canaliculata]|uniref:tyrosine-protein phosphatase non-receptor type 4-like isoform X2 n=1 Tax=Pomacea canaliculata TaxID=400727 RepID=UPI000D72FDDD|nr:tyrosine-protein phosphatase non-receptor type 4-like isoform X2 [Pomacea canaliculata]
MSIKLVSSGSYNVRASEMAHNQDRQPKTVNCVVHFLDETDETFEVDKRSKAQQLLDKVFDHLELVEKDYFGLQFIDMAPGEDGMRWLDPLKTIKKQCRGPPYEFFFRVKFYVSDPSKLAEEYTRYHFFLQVRQDMLSGKLVCSEHQAAALASYAVQSELGDFNPDEHKDGYLNGFMFVPNQTREFEQQVAEKHRQHRGQTPADAEFNFLERAKRLEMYGVDLHNARLMLPEEEKKDQSSIEIQLGVTSAGLVVFQNNLRINTFSWGKIVKISFKRKQFFIQLRREVVTDSIEPPAEEKSGKAQNEPVENLIGFNMTSYRSCKNLWKSCVEHHTFFRLHHPNPPSKKIFSLGSKFSGRTEFQTLEESKRRAKIERTFSRSPSKRYRRTVGAVSRDAILEERRFIDGYRQLSKSQTFSGHSDCAQHALYRRDGFNSQVRATLPHDYKSSRTSWLDARSDKSDDDGGFLSHTTSRDNYPLPVPTKVVSYNSDSKSDTYTQPTYSDYLPNGNCVSDGLVTIRMKPDDHGRFGFNVKGGADQGMPIIVSRVAPETPADLAIPRLNEGDQVLYINGRDVSQHTHEQVVMFIKASRETHSGELVLIVRPNVYVGEDTADEPDFTYIPETHQIASSSSSANTLESSLLLLQEGLESGAAIAQFEQLYRKKPGLTVNVARLDANINKNRYRDISPYDQTRVILKHGVNGDYVNANYVNMEIPGSGIVNRYIAAQGPLPNTCIDFWQMIWEQQSSLVVMLTTKVERGRVKCHQYWPQLYETEDFGPLQITCVKEEETPSFAFREFNLTHVETSEERHIRHMQYIAWPDHGVPDDPSDFLEFVMKVRQARAGMVEPTVVHCSAGIGRTGVLITMETAMYLIEANQPVYPLTIVRQMRDQRAMLIQTSSQYKFVCEAILRVYHEGLVKPLEDFRR